MEKTNNVIAFKPRPKIEDTDLYLTGAHLVSTLREEFENRNLMTQGLNFSFEMLLYGLNKNDKT